jgi:hypothetical protein
MPVKNKAWVPLLLLCPLPSTGRRNERKKRAERRTSCLRGEEELLKGNSQREEGKALRAGVWLHERALA